MVRLNSNTPKIDTVFVMVLFTLFSLTSFVLILLGVKQYKVTADTMSSNYELRTVTSYLSEKVRQNDCNNGIIATRIDGIPAIALTSQIDGETYYTYVYYYDGYIRELFVSRDAVFSIDTGQKIVKLSHFEIFPEEYGVIRVTVGISDGSSRTIYLSTKSRN